MSNPFASAADLALCQCRVGVIHSIQNRQSDARKMLEESLHSGSLPPRHSGVCNYALLQIYVMAQDNRSARTLLSRMGELQMAGTYQARAWALAVEVGIRLKDSRTEGIYLQKLLSVMEKNKLETVELKTLGGKQWTLGEVKKRLALNSPPPQLKNLFQPTPATASIPKELPTPAATPVSSPTPSVSNPPSLGVEGSAPLGTSPQSLSPFFQTSASRLFAFLSEGNISGALSFAAQLGGERELQNALAEGGIGIPAARVLARLQRTSSEDPRNMRVGIILPVGGFYTRFNSRILRSVASFSSSTAVRGVTFEFVIRSISPEPGSAEQAATDLIFEDHVHAILGPVSNSQTLGVIGIAQLFSVPVFALGPVVASPEITYPALVRMGVLAKAQALSLVKHVRENLKANNAAILAPNDPYGYESARLFESISREEGLPIQNIRYYSASTDVPKEDVNGVIGPQDYEARKEEHELLIEQAREKAKKEKKHFDPKKILLPPMLPFDVLFVPDSLSRAKVIASTFAFAGSPHVKMLGDRQWSDSATGRSSIADPFMNGARVPVPRDGEFLSFLRSDLDSPDAYLDLERQAFDALVLLRTAQFRAAGNAGGRMIRAMHESDWTARGTMIFGPVDDLGEPAVNFSLMSYQHGRIVNNLPEWTFPSPVGVEEKKDLKVN